MTMKMTMKMMIALSLVMSCAVCNVALAVSDACCITEFPSCGCQLMDNGDWIKRWSTMYKPTGGSNGSAQEHAFKTGEALDAAIQKFADAKLAFDSAQREFVAAQAAQAKLVKESGTGRLSRREGVSGPRSSRDDVPVKSIRQQVRGSGRK